MATEQYRAGNSAHAPEILFCPSYQRPSMPRWRNFWCLSICRWAKTLSEPNQPIEYVYFLNTGLISTDALTENGETVEIGVIGREGFSGPARAAGPAADVSFGGDPGGGRRAADSIVDRAGGVSKGRNVSATRSFVCVSADGAGSQSVLCNRMHEVEARLARWLLTSADRMEIEVAKADARVSGADAGGAAFDGNGGGRGVAAPEG